jgi:hypothetical protein
LGETEFDVEKMHDIMTFEAGLSRAIYAMLKHPELVRTLLTGVGLNMPNGIPISEAVIERYGGYITNTIMIMIRDTTYKITVDHIDPKVTSQ